jgi:CheY-like chemotaxis protein
MPHHSTFHSNHPHPLIDQDAKNWIILIIDDQQDNLEVTSAVLRFHGVQVYTAVNAEDGLKVLDRVTPTLILLDLSMPKMSGWQMLKIVRESVQWANIPVIALTAHAMDGDRERVEEAGFDGYITKPFDVLQVVSIIKSQLGKVPATA